MPFSLGVPNWIVASSPSPSCPQLQAPLLVLPPSPLLWTSLLINARRASRLPPAHLNAGGRFHAVAAAASAPPLVPLLGWGSLERREPLRQPQPTAWESEGNQLHRSTEQDGKSSSALQEDESSDEVFMKQMLRIISLHNQEAGQLQNSVTLEPIPEVNQLGSCHDAGASLTAINSNKVAKPVFMDYAMQQMPWTLQLHIVPIFRIIPATMNPQRLQVLEVPISFSLRIMKWYLLEQTGCLLQPM
uniref:Uncharacterized protein n=4 Tax=Oryza TaxID=4527 RepID=A0A0E0J011_ORYNI